MKVAIIGCGYVLDHYMDTIGSHPEIELVGVADRHVERASTVAAFYGVRCYPDNESIYRDADVQLIVNLTSIESHYEVVRQSLLAGKHVYSEKPLTTDLAQTQELFSLAKEKGVHLSAAPCNVLSNTVQTMWKAVRDGAVGDPRLVYAEFDDNPIYLMSPEGWRSRTGAPWPFLHEYEQGCTLEHAAYHLTWMAAMFGPAVSLTAFSRCLAPDKTERHLEPADTPDFSVACIVFKSGVVGRLTCSIIAPLDLRMRVIGSEGEVSAETYRHYDAPVWLERFSKLSLNARKARSVRASSLLRRISGVGGRRIPLQRRPGSRATRWNRSDGVLRDLIRVLRKREMGAQDKFLGVAEMVRAIETGKPMPLPPDFVTHVTELTLAIQRAGTSRAPYVPVTTFAPIQPMPFATTQRVDYKGRPPGLVESVVQRLIGWLHRH